MIQEIPIVKCNYSCLKIIFLLLNDFFLVLLHISCSFELLHKWIFLNLIFNCFADLWCIWQFFSFISFDIFVWFCHFWNCDGISFCLGHRASRNYFLRSTVLQSSHRKEFLKFESQWLPSLARVSPFQRICLRESFLKYEENENVNFPVNERGSIFFNFLV